MKKFLIALFAMTLIVISPITIKAKEGVDSNILYSVSPRVVAHQIDRKVSVGNGIYATISGMYTADSSGNILSADLRVSSVTGNRKVYSFNTSISGKNIYYQLSVQGGSGTVVGFLL